MIERVPQEIRRFFEPEALERIGRADTGQDPERGRYRRLLAEILLRCFRRHR